MNDQPVTTQKRKVGELMRPLDEYTTVREDAALKDAFLAMQAALEGAKKADPNEPRDFAVLVLDKSDQVLGRLVVWDVLEGLDPRRLMQIDPMAMVEGFDAWERPLAQLAEKSQNLKVKNLVKPLKRDEYIDADADIEQALHRLIKGRFYSLIALRGRRPVGILRVVDVFQYVCGEIGEALGD